MAVKPHFKSWVPEWLIRIAIFMLLLPNLLLIVIAKTSESAACGYYGIDPNDAEYSLIVLFCSIVAFFPLQIRFANFFVTKDYLLISVILEVLTTFLCYSTRNLELLLIFRFLEGIANCCLATNCIALIFSRLKDERARVIGFSVFFGMVLCLVPFITFASAPIIDSYNYNVLYKIMIYTFIPGSLIFMVIMKRERTNDRVPLRSLDWQSYIIYASIMLLAAYILIYGQQLNWFSDIRILGAIVALVLLIVTFILRQLTLKIPYVNLTVFAYPRFILVFMLILIFYTARGTFNYIVVYLAVVLGMDPIHIGYLFLYDIAGIIIGVIISSRLLILKKSMRLILLGGFTLQFIFSAG